MLSGVGDIEASRASPHVPHQYSVLISEAAKASLRDISTPTCPKRVTFMHSRSKFVDCRSSCCFAFAYSNPIHKPDRRLATLPQPNQVGLEYRDFCFQRNRTSTNTGTNNTIATICPKENWPSEKSPPAALVMSA